jgi:hypothetical protein
MTIDEPASFDEFFQVERDRLYRVMYVITGHQQEAEDAETLRVGTGRRSGEWRTPPGTCTARQ